MARPPRVRRSRGRDPLGLRRALSDRLLPALVAAMALLAALALAGAEGAAALTARWEAGAAAAVTVQLPPGAAPGASTGARLERALAALEALPEVAEAKPMSEAQMQALLRPWLGEAPPVALPLVIELRLAALPASPEALAGRIVAAVPGAVVESHGVWVARLVALAQSLQAVALAALVLVAGIAAAVVAVAVRAGIAARRAAIALLHDMGATDSDIAGRFAGRAGLLVGVGALLGTLLAAPVLAGFADLAAPLLGQAPAGSLTGLPWASLPWAALALLPLLGVALGWLTAQVTVRRWLRRLP